MAENSNYGSGGWGRVGDSNFELELPSGSLVLVRELEIPELIDIGVLDIVDKFGQIAVGTDEENTEETLKEMSERSDDFKKIFEVVDKICSRAVVKPKVYLASDDEDLDPEKVYAHLIAFNDRIAIFEEAIDGMSDMFQSGEGQAENVANLPDVEVVQQVAKRSSRDKSQKKNV